MRTLERGDLVVVTGAAQGIGRAVALRLAKDGARPALWDVKADGLAETAALCRKLGAEATTATVDMGEATEVERAAAALIDGHGAPFGFVSNAGIFPRSAILQTDPATWERVLKVNLVGAFLLARFLGPAMVAAKRGAAVTIASGRALQGTPRGAHYAASKAGLVSFTKSLALELAPHAIRVNCVIPGVTETAQPLEDSTLEEVRARQPHSARAHRPARGHRQRRRLPARPRFVLHDGPGGGRQRRRHHAAVRRMLP